MKTYLEPICIVLAVEEEDILTLSAGDSETYYDWDSLIIL